MNASLHDRIPLNGRWNLSGWLRHYWRLQTTMEIDSPTLPMIPTVPADVPGSVHGALREAGVIPDWNDALASYQSEWVNNREWIYDREVTIPE
jgi:beta-mannosidase